jgi:hypothetical protein
MTDARIKSARQVGIRSHIAGWHLCWSALVAIGQAQRVANFSFWPDVRLPSNALLELSFGRDRGMLVQSRLIDPSQCATARHPRLL